MYRRKVCVTTCSKMRRPELLRVPSSSSKPRYSGKDAPMVPHLQSLLAVVVVVESVGQAIQCVSPAQTREGRNEEDRKVGLSCGSEGMRWGQAILAKSSSQQPHGRPAAPYPWSRPFLRLFLWPSFLPYHPLSPITFLDPSSTSSCSKPIQSAYSGGFVGSAPRGLVCLDMFWISAMLDRFHT